MNSSTKSTSPTPVPTKYRLACDSCQHSKIRCDQDRPRCRRCAKKGIECVYSPARRAGRPRTRNTNKSFSDAEKITSRLKEHSTPMPDHSGIAVSKPSWTPASAQPAMPTAFEDHSSTSSCSFTSTLPTILQTVQAGSSDSLEYLQYQHTETDFLQGLPDFTDSLCETPQQITDRTYPMSPEFHIAPELLNMGFCEATSDHHLQRVPRRDQSTSTTMLLDVELPYFGLLTPQDQTPDQRQEATSVRIADRDNLDSCSFTVFPPQEVESNFSQLSDQTQTSTEQCNCIVDLLNHLSMPSAAYPNSSLIPTSAALSTSRALVTCCCTTLACPNACSTRPSTALIICEAIDRAINSLKLGGPSLWTMPDTSLQNTKSSSSSSSPSSTSGHDGIILSVADEEHELLRCGTLLIRGVDRRAVMRVLLAKRVQDMQHVLERLRDTFLSSLLVGGPAGFKKPIIALCADVVGEFAGKVAHVVEMVKLQV